MMGFQRNGVKFPYNNKKDKKISYDKMLELANDGAKVLHNKCVEIAKENKIKILVKSVVNSNSIGTVVGN